MTVQTVWKVVKVDERDRFVSVFTPEPLLVEYKIGEISVLREPFDHSWLFVFDDPWLALGFVRSGLSDLNHRYALLEGQADVRVSEEVPMLFIETMAGEVVASEFDAFDLIVRYWQSVSSIHFVQVTGVRTYKPPEGTLFASWFKPEKVIWRYD